MCGLRRLGLKGTEMEKADLAAQQAEAIYAELGGDTSGRVDDYSRLVYLMAEIAQARGQYEQASFYYQRSVVLFGQTGDRLQSGRAFLRLAEIATHLGASGEASEWLREARSILERTGAPRDLQRLAELSSRI